MNGIQHIEKERTEQLEKHGFDLKHDAEVNSPSTLIDAAMFTLTFNQQFYPQHWGEWFLNNLQGKDDVEKTAIAGAFLAAAIDLMQYDGGDYARPAVTDKQRLDFLQMLHDKSSMRGVICRDSTTGRGWRLHETSDDAAVEDVREAIDNYIQTQEDEV